MCIYICVFVMCMCIAEWFGTLVNQINIPVRSFNSQMFSSVTVVI